jgi:hypothetical protein
MLQFFKNVYYTLHFMMNRKAVLDELAIRSAELDKRGGIQPEAAAQQDCIIKQGWAIVCCSPNCDPARCNALADPSKGQTSVPCASGTCKKLGKPSCRGG